jgi:hypothetical protein
MAKKPLVLALVACFLVNISPPARASIFTGTCALRLEFSFDTPVQSLTAPVERAAAPSYQASIAGAADFNPLAPGVQACVVDNTPTSPFKGTSGFLSGTAIAWACEAAAGSGTWEQDWHPDPGAVFGAHTIAGTWGNWVVAVNNSNLSFTGTANLTVAPEDEAKLAECELGGISDLSMVGVMHFQDPPPPTG